MQFILKEEEINIKNHSSKSLFLLRNSINLSTKKWFKGSRSRGIR